MMWAVLVGEDEQIVKMLWGRTVDPLRAALMASQLYRKLASLPHLRADQPTLLAQSDVRRKQMRQQVGRSVQRVAGQ